MGAFDALSFWREPDFRGRVGWYREVAADRLPAKYRICAALLAWADLGAAEEELWAALQKGTREFLELKARVRAGEELPGVGAKPSLLDLGAETRVSSAFHHHGEELVYRGTHGSGTIFFTSCNMRCAFCQNGDISTDRLNGEPVSARTLAAIELARTGWYWETVTANLQKLEDWGEDFAIRHLVMPGHVECCTVPVLDRIAERMPEAPVNIMDQYHPDNYCDPANDKFMERYRPLFQ